VHKQIQSLYRELLTAEAIAASGTKTTDLVDLTQSTGKLKLQYTITGDGTFQIEVAESLSGITYITNGTEVATGLVKGSGIVAVDLGVSCYDKFIVTETGGADGGVVTLGIAAQ
jgi:hypothetical protein